MTTDTYLPTEEEIVALLGEEFGVSEDEVWEALDAVLIWTFDG